MVHDYCSYQHGYVALNRFGICRAFTGGFVRYCSRSSEEAERQQWPTT